jgi:hypothetical protein
MHNAKWCLLGCSIGDFGVILYFQNIVHTLSTLSVMALAIIAGLTTSIILETIILMKNKFNFKNALNMAFGMSFISMLIMEIAMNSFDYALTGGAILNWWVTILALIVGFLAPLPYNYYRLKKFNESCH